VPGVTTAGSRWSTSPPAPTRWTASAGCRGNSAELTDIRHQSPPRQRTLGRRTP
jgi:hypothetical protein